MKNSIFTVLVLLFFTGCTPKNKTEELNAKIEELEMKNDSLSQLLTQQTTTENYWFNPDYEGIIFTENNIDNPADFIESSLRRQTELIPIDAVLGGTMAFGNVQILGSEWLIADFGDGHILGFAIYKFRLNERKELEFEFLEFLVPE